MTWWKIANSHFPNTTVNRAWGLHSWKQHTADYWTLTVCIVLQSKWWRASALFLSLQNKGANTQKNLQKFLLLENYNTIQSFFFSATNDVKLICITIVRTHILLETYTVYLDLPLLFAFKWDYIHRQWANFNNNDKKSMNRDLEKISRSTALPLSHNTYHNIPLREQITL